MASRAFKRLRQADHVIDLEPEDDDLAAETAQQQNQRKSESVDKRPASASTRRKREARSTRNSDFCCGRITGHLCCFSSTRFGERARPSRAKSQCIFCDAQAMLQACRSTQGRGRVLKSLRFLRSFYEDNSRGTMLQFFVCQRSTGTSCTTKP